MAKIDSYRDLEVWQRGMQLVKRVYRLTAALPGGEKFGLVSQLRRASVSIPSNIAEGWARNSTKLYLRHISIVRGSLAELETQLILCVELEYVTESRLSELMEFAALLGRQLNALERSLRQAV